MRFLTALFAVVLAAAALAADRITSVTVDGVSYVQIQDAHLTSGGRVVLLYGSGGKTLPASQLPQAFLDSWGITPEQVAESKAKSDKQAAEALDFAVRSGKFREVDGIVYDMRRSQAGWRVFAGAKVMQVVEDGALVDPTPGGQNTPTYIFVRHLPRVYADNDKADFMARPSGEFSFVNKFGYGHTIHSYDVGRVCRRDEVPDAVLRGLAAAAPSGRAADPGTPPPMGRAPRLDRGLHGIGTGFFVTKDGYFMTDFHVVKEAARLEVETKAGVFPAKVIQSDRVNDLALLKVEGAGFTPLAISRKDSDLGDAVFTIGFPNIDMQGTAPKYTDGKISSDTGIRDDEREYQISVPVQPGNSGGPLCDANGDVVGLVVARLNDMAALRESGAVPQNVNYATKSKYALPLLAKIKSDAPLPGAGEKKNSPIRLVEEAIGMVKVY